MIYCESDNDQAFDVIFHQNLVTSTLTSINRTILSGHLVLCFFAYDPHTILIGVCILGLNDDRSTIIYEFIFMSSNFDLIKLSGGHSRSSLTRSRRSSVFNQNKGSKFVWPARNPLHYRRFVQLRAAHFVETSFFLPRSLPSANFSQFRLTPIVLFLNG